MSNKGEYWEYHKTNMIFFFRAKEVDLVPYLTTRLVDDFASHIRLYRRALDKVALHQIDSKSMIDLGLKFHLPRPFFRPLELLRLKYKSYIVN